MELGPSLPLRQQKNSLQHLIHSFPVHHINAMLASIVLKDLQIASNLVEPNTSTPPSMGPGDRGGESHFIFHD